MLSNGRTPWCSHSSKIKPTASSSVSSWILWLFWRVMLHISSWKALKLCFYWRQTLHFYVHIRRNCDKTQSHLLRHMFAQIRNLERRQHSSFLSSFPGGEFHLFLTSEMSTLTQERGRALLRGTLQPTGSVAESELNTLQRCTKTPKS